MATLLPFLLLALILPAALNLTGGRRWLVLGVFLLFGFAAALLVLLYLRARAKAVAPGEWIYNLGGWAVEQFADDPRPFTREELDKVVPNNPVFLQASYYEAYLNSRALQAMGIDEKTANNSVVRDSAGHPTGRITEAGFRALVGKQGHCLLRAGAASLDSSACRSAIQVA